MESLFCIVCVCCMSRSQAKLVGKCEMFRLGTIDFGTKRSSANTFFPRRSPSRSLHSLWFRALPLTLSFFYFTLSDSILCATAVWFEKMWVRKATTSPFLLTNTCKYSHIVYLCVRARVRANTHTHIWMSCSIHTVVAGGGVTVTAAATAFAACLPCSVWEFSLVTFRSCMLDDVCAHAMTVAKKESKKEKESVRTVSIRLACTIQCAFPYGCRYRSYVMYVFRFVASTYFLFLSRRLSFSHTVFWKY